MMYKHRRVLWANPSTGIASATYAEAVLQKAERLLKIDIFSFPVIIAGLRKFPADANKVHKTKTSQLRYDCPSFRKIRACRHIITVFLS